MATNSYGLNNQTFNTVSVYKGKLGSVPIFSWDFISPCIKEKCGIYNRCRFAQGRGLYPLEKKHSSVLERFCTTQKRYVDSVFETLIFANKDTLTPEDSIRLGLMVMPLFGHLIKLKIAEAGEDRVLFEDIKGMKKINPIYREIRDTVKSISTMLNELGLEQPALPDTQDFANGDPNYYDRMYGDEGREEGNGFTSAEVVGTENKKTKRSSKRKLDR